MLECIVHRQTASYNLLQELQSECRRGRSTDSAVLEVGSDITDAIDTDSLVLLAFLDHSAAFDTVDHDTMQKRLVMSFGSTERLCSGSSRIRPYHSTLVINQPQDSVLGPLLFLLTTTDVGTIVHVHGLLHLIYADDTQSCISTVCHVKVQS